MLLGEGVEQPRGVFVLRIAGEHRLQFRTGCHLVAGGHVRLGEREPRCHALGAPQRDLQLVYGVQRAAATEEQAAKQQVCLALIRVEVHGAAQFGDVDMRADQAQRFGLDRKAIRQWLIAALVKRVFGGVPDTVLRPMRDILRAHTDGFPLDNIIEKFKGTPKPSRVIALKSVVLTSRFIVSPNSYCFELSAASIPVSRCCVSCLPIEDLPTEPSSFCKVL